jgi:hypothetical protein
MRSGGAIEHRHDQGSNLGARRNDSDFPASASGKRISFRLWSGSHRDIRHWWGGISAGGLDDLIGV